MSADLDALCEAHGIATRYRDLWHNEHEPPEATKRALLRAMGIDERAPPARSGVADSACVVRLGATIDRLPLAGVALHAQAVAWRIALEAGGELCGEGRVVRSDASAAADTRTSTCAALGVDADSLAQLPSGYHTLHLAAGGEALTLPLIACPPRCVPPPPGAARRFGPAVQLYALRSNRNWGIGDFTDLAALARVAARHGAGFVGLNPLHELFLDRPAQASPYSPSSRLAVNPLYLDVDAIAAEPDADEVRAAIGTAPFKARLAALRAAPLVDYAGVAEAKLPMLRRLHAQFRRTHLRETPSAQGRAFRAFADAHGNMVKDAALFDALQAALARSDRSIWGWPAWPEAFRDHGGRSVLAFAQSHADEVEFFLWLQWQCDRQLAAAAAAARDAGMPIGLYRDLAVGANPGGADTWREPGRYASGVHVGAPPDEFNQRGQDWGLPPWIPGKLAAGGYAPWVALLRANMRHAGGLRIDHVMGLMRLFWIPEGQSPADGTYVRYPLADLLAVLALESHRNGALVVGEDLGTVPDEVRAALRDAGVHSYRVLYFERGADGEFVPPDRYPQQALVTVSTHDLPTLRGYVEHADLATRDELSLFPSDELRERTHADRAADVPRLGRALVRESLLAGEIPSYNDALVAAVHAYAARTPCALMTLQLEDVFGEAQQVNLPATTDDVYPNWRRKITVALEDWDADGRFAAVCAAVRAQGRGDPA